MLNTKVEDQIERIIDQASLRQVLEAVAYVCWEKAEHIRSNWQDEHLARDWDAAGKVVDTASRRASVKRV
jgi:hypothetical protein